MCIDTYARICKSKITTLSPKNGLIDSISTLLSSFNDHTRQLVKLLIFPFQNVPIHTITITPVTIYLHFYCIYYCDYLSVLLYCNSSLFR